MNKLNIEIGGKERTLKFNNVFAREYEKKQRQYNEDVTAIGIMIFAGMKAWSVVSETPMEATFEDCCDWGDEMVLNNDSEKMNKILEAFQESNFYKAVEDIKKKTEEMIQQIGMPSNGMLTES
jgi:hypothetical protein